MQTTKYRLFGTAIMLAMITASCATDGIRSASSLPRDARHLYSEYLTKPHFRALATTRDLGGKGWATSSIWSRDSAQEAVEAIMQHCAENLATTDVVAYDCRLYAVGDTVVAGMSKQEIEDAIARYQSQVMETDPVLSQLQPGLGRNASQAFLEYKQKGHFRAFAASRRDADGGSVYGRSWSYGSVSRAVDIAMSSCQKAKAERGVATDCELYALGDIVVFDMRQSERMAVTAFYETNPYADNDEVAALVLEAPSAESVVLLTGEEILVKIIGNTMEGFSSREGVAWTEHYLENGAIKGIYDGEKGTAEWTLSGAELCWDYPGNANDDCAALSLTGSEVVFFQGGKPAGRAKVMEGNSQGL